MLIFLKNVFVYATLPSHSCSDNADFNLQNTYNNAKLEILKKTAKIHKFNYGLLQLINIITTKY